MSTVGSIKAWTLIKSRIIELEIQQDDLLKRRDAHSKTTNNLTSRTYNDFAKQLANVEEALQHNKNILLSITT